MLIAALLLGRRNPGGPRPHLPAPRHPRAPRAVLKGTADRREGRRRAAQARLRGDGARGRDRGVVGVVKNGSGPRVLFRTELDAFPVEEKPACPTRARRPGRCTRVVTTPTWRPGRARRRFSLEWLARLSDHIPDPGNVAPTSMPTTPTACAARGPPRNRDARSTRRSSPRSPSWARLIANVFQADPLVCKRCGGPLEVVATITDTVAIRRTLDHLGLSPPEKPPPDVRDVVRAPVEDEGREIGASSA